MAKNYPSITIEEYSSKYRHFGLNLTALKTLSIYCKDHPNKGFVMLYHPDNKSPLYVDPHIRPLREKERIYKCFASMSLFGIVLFNTDKDHYNFAGKYINGVMLNIQIKKTINGGHVPYLVAVVKMLEEVEKDFRSKKNNAAPAIKIEEEEVVSDPLSQIVNAVKSEKSTEADVSRLAGMLLNKSLLPAEHSEEFNIDRMHRKTTFSSLPDNIQQAINQVSSSN